MKISILATTGFNNSRIFFKKAEKKTQSMKIRKKKKMFQLNRALKYFKVFKQKGASLNLNQALWERERRQWDLHQTQVMTTEYSLQDSNVILNEFTDADHTVGIHTEETSVVSKKCKWRIWNLMFVFLSHFCLMKTQCQIPKMFYDDVIRGSKCKSKIFFG